eukprot:6670458-Pyramimonas_sp.AAC.1
MRPSCGPPGQFLASGKGKQTILGAHGNSAQPGVRLFRNIAIFVRAITAVSLGALHFVLEARWRIFPSSPQHGTREGGSACGGEV